MQASACSREMASASGSPRNAAARPAAMVEYAADSTPSVRCLKNEEKGE